MRREERRYPILLALVAQSAVDQLDEVIALFDQAVSARESRARTRTGEELAARARKGESRQLLMDVILPALADPSVPDEQVGGLFAGADRDERPAGRGRGGLEAAGQGPRPAVGAGLLLLLPAAVHPPGCWRRSTSPAARAPRT
jgi:hypothetical protein